MNLRYQAANEDTHRPDQTPELDACALALGERSCSTIGRAPGCDLVLADQSVSRVHASIERVDDQHLLQDRGSANGTFLNGLRLVPSHAFALREGDLIEIGKARLVYGNGVACESVPFGFVEDLLRTERAYSVSSLLRDGCHDYGGEVGATTQAHLLSALEGAAREVGLGRCLALVADELAVEIVGLYSGTVGACLDLLATHPDGAKLPRLAPLALRAWAERSARHVEATVLTGERSLSDTSVLPIQSALAIPFFRHQLGCVVAVERLSGKRFDRRDVAHAAVLGERVARAVCIGALNGNETPFGCGD